MPHQFFHQLKINNKNSQRTTNQSAPNGKNHEAIQAKLENARHFLKLRGYELSQHNGQRISKLISIDEKQVEDKSEVFIGKLPRDLYEDELLPLLEQAGRVYKMRLMMEFSGCNRGFAFANYVTSKEANLACALLSQTLIRPDCPPIGVVKSFDNKCLFFGNLPIKVTKKAILNELKRHLTDVEDVEMFKVEPSSTSRFANVHFKTHEAATQARRLLLPGDVRMFNRIITVDWVKKDSSTRERSSSVQQPLQLSLNGSHYHQQQHQQPHQQVNASSSSSSSLIPAQLINLNNNNNNTNLHQSQQHADRFFDCPNFSETVPLMPFVSGPILGAKTMHMLESCGFNNTLLHYV